jgi:regulation of enolase protein 1 (concanavalin A-like superfamily)
MAWRIRAVYGHHGRDQRIHRRHLWALAGLLISGISTPPAPALAAPLPEGWITQDIGSTDPAGSTEVDDKGVWTIRGSGSDIEGSSDNFHFAYQKVKGDATITAHFLSMEPGDPTWTKMGPMIRSSDADDAQNFLIKMTSAVGVRIQGRNSQYPNTFSTFPPALSLSRPQPVWLRLQRVGQQVSGFYSMDGKIWTSGGPALVLDALEEEALVGLANTSHQQGTLAVGLFDNVSIEPGASLVSGIRSCSSSTGVTLSWSALKGAESYVIYRGPAGETDTTKFVKVNDQVVTGTSFSDNSPDLVKNRKYTYAVVPVVGGTERGWGTIAAGQMVPLAPPGFTITSIDEDPDGVIDYDGGCTPPLGAFYDATTETIIVRGSGAEGFGDTIDQLNFTHTEVEGDFQVTVKALTRPVRQGSSTKAGLMIREGLAPGARRANLVLAASQNGLTFEWRDTADGSSDQAENPLITAVDLVPPVWIRMTRKGDQITAEYSLDGTTWKGGDDPQNQITLKGLAAKLNVGLAITSKNLTLGRQITEAVFQNLEIKKQ